MAADTGHTRAQLHLGILLATMLDPPEMTEALMRWERAAEAGVAEAQQLLRHLGND